MPVEYQVDSLDTVDESIRGAYVENEGKFNFDPDKYAEIKAQGLKSKNKELLGKLTKATEGSKRFEKFAELTDDELSELLELRENKDKLSDKGKAPSAADAERLAQLEKQHKKALDKVSGEKTAAETRATDLEKKVKYYELTVPIREAAIKADAFAEDLNLILFETQARFSLNEDGKIVVLDEDGDPTDITVQKFFELYKAQRPKFFKPSGATGSGAPSATTSANGKKAMRAADWSKLQLSNPAQAAAFMKEVKEGKATLID